MTGWLVDGRTDFYAGCKESARELEGERRKNREKENLCHTVWNSEMAAREAGVRVLQG